MNDVRELEGLLDDNRMTADELVQRGAKGRARRREDFSRLPGQKRRRRRAGYVLFEDAATEPARQCENEDQTEAGEDGTDERYLHRGITSLALRAWVPCCE